jgi:ketosteroid isomerase-like protein
MNESKEIQRFVADWYRKLDVHAAADEVVAMVAADVEFVLPEGPIKGRDQFRKWYEGVIAIFFDEVHEIESVHVAGDSTADKGAAVSVEVVWEARYWQPPAAASRHLKMLARQQWTLGREQATGRLVIRKYTVDSLEPLPGSAPLPTAPSGEERKPTVQRAFYEEQIELLTTGQIEKLVEQHYTDDAILMGNNGQDFVVRCSGSKQPLVEHFRRYLNALGALRIESTDRFVETEGAVLFEATVQVQKIGRVRVYDAWKLRDGKIAVHFTGLLSSTATDAQQAAQRKSLERYYELVNQGDWAAWLELFDDNVSGDEQIAGNFEGIEVLRGAGEAINKGYKPFHMRPLNIVIAGDEACVIWQCESKNANGVCIAYPGDPERPVIGANYFRFKKGKIVYMRTIHDVIPFQPFVQQNRPFQVG